MLVDAVQLMEHSQFVFGADPPLVGLHLVQEIRTAAGKPGLVLGRVGPFASAAGAILKIGK